MSNNGLSPIRSWLVERFSDYDVSELPVVGTYGLVWLLEGRNYKKNRFAVKTLPLPGESEAGKFPHDLAYLQREFRLWLQLPPHQNVLPALGFEIAELKLNDEELPLKIPIMRMPRMDGSLDAWVANDSISRVDKLIAIAQAVNGLIHMYRHGFQGHGDLKPSNILYSDLRPRFELDERINWPSQTHPWQVRIADLGWADAWVDLGFSNKSLREFMAPERFDKIVVPQKSDMFAMGVIVAMLLSGRHPSKNLKKSLQSDGKWCRSINNAEWDLQLIDSRRIKSLVIDSLSHDPDHRPTPENFLNTILEELLEVYSQPIGKTLELWNERSDSFSELEHVSWAARQSIQLGVEQSAASMKAIELRLNAIEISDVQSCEEWIELARSLVVLLHDNASESSKNKLLQIEMTAMQILKDHFIFNDLDDLERIGSRADLPVCVSKFERLSEDIGMLLSLAGLPSDLTQLGNLFPKAKTTLAAVCFHLAGSLRQDGDLIAMNMMLDRGVELNSFVYDLYYFRASWNWEQLLIRSVTKNAVLNSNNLEVLHCLSDAKRAVSISPNRPDAHSLLNEILKYVDEKMVH